MTKFFFGKVIDVLKQKPLKLWGLSLLATLLTSLAYTFGVLPIISVPIALVLSAGMSLIYLKGYVGNESESRDIFRGFDDFKRVAGGMLWMELWIFIWGLIPVVGPVFAVIKSYEYKFTPYILMTEPEISAMDALKESQRRTDGHKGQMFACEILLVVAVYLVFILLGLLSTIRYIGILFGIILILFLLCVIAFGPVVYGLLGAAFYLETPNLPKKERYVAPQPVYAPEETDAAQNVTYCPHCGSANSEGSRFCGTCGTPLQ